MLCCFALAGCGEDSDGAPGSEEPRRNVFVKTLYPHGCIPRPLATDYQGDDGRTGVFTFEAMAGPCDCSRPGRDAATSGEIAGVRDELIAGSVCGLSTGVDCSDYCGCRILELAGPSSDPASPLYACQNQTTVSDASLVGFCYVDPGRVDGNGMPAPLGNPELLAACEPGYLQRIRFIGADTPLPGASLFIVFYGPSGPPP